MNKLHNKKTPSILHTQTEGAIYYHLTNYYPLYLTFNHTSKHQIRIKTRVEITKNHYMHIFTPFNRHTLPLSHPNVIIIPLLLPPMRLIILLPTYIITSLYTAIHNISTHQNLLPSLLLLIIIQQHQKHTKNKIDHIFPPFIDTSCFFNHPNVIILSLLLL